MNPKACLELKGNPIKMIQEQLGNFMLKDKLGFVFDLVQKVQG
jgi:hypothetical protein